MSYHNHKKAVILGVIGITTLVTHLTWAGNSVVRVNGASKTTFSRSTADSTQQQPIEPELPATIVFLPPVSGAPAWQVTPVPGGLNVVVSPGTEIYRSKPSKNVLPGMVLFFRNSTSSTAEVFLPKPAGSGFAYWSNKYRGNAFSAAPSLVGHSGVIDAGNSTAPTGEPGEVQQNETGSVPAPSWQQGSIGD